jgi:branched-chain amino acid transport system permease protein
VIQIIISSIITGSVYAVMALGLVAVFKTTRVFNFAHGQIAALSAYMGYTASSSWDLPFLPVVVVGGLVGAATAALMEVLVLRRMYRRSMLELVIATFGISLILRSVILRSWGPDVRTIANPLSDRNVDLLGATAPVYGLCLVAFTALIVAVLTIVLRRTTVGLRLRATFDDPVAARMQGVRVGLVRTASWMLGGALAGVGGVLLTPILFLTPSTMDDIMIIGFAAAVVGGFSSFYGAVTGGVLVAYVANVLAAYVSLRFKDVFLYGLVIAFLWVRPNGLFGEADLDEAEQEGERIGALGRAWQGVIGGVTERTARVRENALRGYAPQWGVLVIVVALIFLAPAIFGSSWQLNLTTWLINLIAVAGLALITFYGGRISLAQNAFVLIGGYLTALILGGGHQELWPLVVVAAAILTGLAGALFELPSLRLRGAYYALTTLALGLLVPLLALKWTAVTGGVDGKAVPYIKFGGELATASQMYMVIAVVAAVVLITLVGLRNTRAGRAVVAVRDTPAGAASIGIAGAPRRLLIAGIGAGLGGLSGALSALSNNLVTPTQFDFNYALALLVAAVLAGSIVGSAWGAALITLVPVLLKNEPVYAQAAYGVIVLLTLFVVPHGRDVADVLRRLRPTRSARWRAPDLVPGQPPRAERQQAGI